MPEEHQGALPIRPTSRSGTSRARESDWIGKKLDQVYGEAMAEPIPEAWMALIRKIDAGPKSEG